MEYGTDMMVLLVVAAGEGLVVGCDGVVGLGDLDGVVMGEEVVCEGVVGFWEWWVDLAMESDLLIKKLG